MMEHRTHPCAICNLPEAIARPDPQPRDVWFWACPRCGQYQLSQFDETNLSSLLTAKPNLRAPLSYRVNRMQRSSSSPVVDNTIMSVVEGDPSLPTPAEQADNLILLLGDRLAGKEGQHVFLDYNLEYMRIGGSNPSSVPFLLRELDRRSLLVNADTEIGSESKPWLTLDGWSYYEELQRGRSDSRRAFMAMEFGNEAADRVFRECFKPAAALTGFHLERIDERPEAGSIPNRMRLEILRARFVVADLTNNNPGAYWEAGYAEGLGKPVIYTCEKGFFERKKTHFDVTQQQHVLWDEANLVAAAESLKMCIRVTLPEDAKLED